MHKGEALSVVLFESAKNPLQSLQPTAQLAYMKAYLIGAGAASVAIEPNYFDRDYLDEFSAFYSKSARGYSNICKRLHFFSTPVSTRLLNSAINGVDTSIKKLQTSYLGFIILRPLSIAPFGRTVLSWYTNKDQNSERITPVLRTYTCHVLGIPLRVLGIPWQQQDRGVSACATIALWSMFHSSAFDANHSVPTTVEVTKNAHNGSSGRRAFPSIGLSIPELQEAIFSQKLTPKLLRATKSDVSNDVRRNGFERQYLSSMCAANIRSGYPVLLVGDYVHRDSDQQHAICCIGFREKEQTAKDPGTYSTMDDETDIFYVHDDNVGPNVRCKLTEKDGFAVLTSEPPSYIDPNTVQPQPEQRFEFRPSIMLIAVHNEIRMDAESLVDQGSHLAKMISSLLNEAYPDGLSKPAISYNTQFLSVQRLFSDYLELIFEDDKALLGKVRRSLGRDAPPLCLHIGLVSLGICNNQMSRLIDVLYDTTDSAMNRPVLAHIIYDEKLLELFKRFPRENISAIFGAQILGFS